MRIQLMMDNEVVASIDLGENGQLVGSAMPSNILIDDPSVSHTHARIFQRGGKALIVDLGSAHGTIVAGQRAEAPMELKDGDSVQLGNTVFQVRILESTPQPDAQVATDIEGDKSVRSKPPPLPRSTQSSPPLTPRNQSSPGLSPPPTTWKKSLGLVCLLLYMLVMKLSGCF